MWSRDGWRCRDAASAALHGHWSPSNIATRLSVHGFAKSGRVNVSNKELKALKLLATVLLTYTAPALRKAIQAGGELIEIHENG